MQKLTNKRKKKIEAFNQAESTIYQTEKTLNELGDKISSGEKEDIEKAIADLKAVKDNQMLQQKNLRKLQMK